MTKLCAATGFGLLGNQLKCAFCGRDQEPLDVDLSPWVAPPPPAEHCRDDSVSALGVGVEGAALLCVVPSLLVNLSEGPGQAAAAPSAFLLSFPPPLTSVEDPRITAPYGQLGSGLPCSLSFCPASGLSCAGPWTGLEVGGATMPLGDTHT